MEISGVSASVAGLQPRTIPTLVSTQQEAQKEAITGVNDGDESSGGNVNKLA